MSFTKERTTQAQAKQQSDERDHDAGMCIAFGCPLKGTWSDGSTGRYVCGFHGVAQPDHWQHTTKALREHAWLLALLKSLWSPLPHQDWRHHAHAFWEGADDPLPPHSRESRDAYRARMWDELHWRVGTRRARPRHAVPEHVNTHHAGAHVVAAGAMCIGTALLEGPLGEAR